MIALPPVALGADQLMVDFAWPRTAVTRRGEDDTEAGVTDWELEEAEVPIALVARKITA